MSTPAAIPPVIPRALPRDRIECFFRWVGGALLVCLLLLALAAYGVTGYFRLSSEMAGLRDGLQAASGREWHRTIALNVGGFTFGAARAGLSFVKMEEEARVALQTIQACEVGIYQTTEVTESTDHPAMLAAADKTMQKKGWERVVGVIADNSLVAVYVPAKISSTSRMKCAVMVCEGHQMILASTRANLDPAIKLAKRKKNGIKQKKKKK
jgi:hypothetical protein